MGSTLRGSDPKLTHLTISGGNRAEPRLMMAHPTWRVRRPWLAVATIIAIVVIIGLAGLSR